MFFYSDENAAFTSIAGGRGFMIDYKVRLATMDDVSGILSVLHHNLIGNKKEEDNFESNGFLVHAFTSDDIQKAILDNQHNIVLVATDGLNVVGYTFGIDLQGIFPEWLGVPMDIKNQLSTNKILL